MSKSLRNFSRHEVEELRDWIKFMVRNGAKPTVYEWWENFYDSVYHVAHVCGVSKRRAKKMIRRWMQQMYPD